MQRRVDRLGAVGLQIFHYEIEETVPRLERLAVINKFQAGVEVAVMAQASFDVLRLELDFLKDGRIGLEADECTVRFIAGFAFLLVFELALLEGGLDKFALAMAADEEFLRERIHSLGANSIQPDAELEHVIVVFGAGVDLRYAIDDFSEGNAAPEITDRNCFVRDRDLDLLTVAHNEFIDAVIDDLFEQDIAAIVVMGAIADAANVHAGAQSDMFEGRERLDFTLVVNVFFSLCHGYRVKAKG